MNKQMYLDIRKAINRKDIEFVTTTIQSFPPLVQIKDAITKYYMLLIKGEVYRSKKDFIKAKLILEEALNIVPLISLDQIEKASVYGRFAFCLYKLKDYNEALTYYVRAKDLTASDVGRNQYYTLMLLNCLRKLKKFDEFRVETKKALNTLLTSKVSNLDRKLKFIGEITFVNERGNQLLEMEKFVLNFSITTDSSSSGFLKAYLLAHIAHASCDYDKLVQNKNICINSIPQEWPVPQKLQILNNLASMFKTPFGDYPTAQTLLEDALLLVGENRLEWKTFILNSLGSILRFTGNYSQAIEYLEESVQISRKNNDLGTLGFTHNSLGMIFTLTGKYKKAQSHYNRSLDLNFRNNRLRGLGYTYGSMGWLESVQGNFSLANELYSKSIDSFKVNSYPPSIILLNKAIILSQIPSSDDSEIQKLLAEAKNQIWKKKNLLDKGRYFISLGNINLNKRKHIEAENDFLHALKFIDAYEVKTQGLLGATKVRVDLYFQTDDSEHLYKIKKYLNKLKSIIKNKNSIFWLEVEFLAAMLDIYEGDFQAAEEKIEPLLIYTKKNSIEKLNSQIKKQLNTLSIFKAQQRIEDQVKAINTFDDIKIQSTEDITAYLKEMSLIFHSHVDQADD